MIKFTKIKELIFQSILFLVIVVMHNGNAAEYSMGIKGGMGMADFWGRDSYANISESEMRTGSCAAVFFSAQFHPLAAAQIELDYVKKGKRLKLAYTSTTYSDTDGIFSNTQKSWEEQFKFDYIEVPIFLKLFPVRTHKIAVSLYGGPFLDYLIIAKNDINDNNVLVWMDMKDNVKKFDAGLALGCGIEIPFKYGKIIFDICYSRGFLTTDIVTEIEKQIDPSALPADRKNQLLGFMIGYAYEL